MKKILFPLALMAFAVTFTSCRKENLESPVKPEPSSGLTFTASIGNIETRAMLLLDRNVIWNTGDSISVNGVRFVGTPTAKDPKIAEFVQADNQMPPQSPFHAFFPAGIRTAEQKDNSGTLPARQIYAEGKVDNVPMYAYCDDGSGMLNFKNICGVLVVKVGPEDIDEVASIRVSSTDEAMSGDFSVVGDSVAVLTDDAKDEMGNVVLVCEDPVAIEEETWFLIAIPAQKYSDINIELSSDGETYTKGMLTKKTTGDSISVDCGTVYPVEFVADAPTANCYIATKDTVLHIKTCIGNSSELLSHVKSAKVLWESDGTNGTQTEKSLISDISYQRGWITCNTTAAKGNAVIAAYDEDNVILWSWHVWLTDQPEEQEYNKYAGTMMDRNLGATSTARTEPSTCGLLYQWGRKDPFLGASAYDPGSDSSIRAVSTNLEIWETMRALVSVSTTVQYPTSFVTSVTGAWCRESDGVWNSEKTLYDPCPAGWRVPDGGILGVWNRAASGSAPGYERAEYGFECGNCEGGYFTTKAEECWYPAAGCMDSSDGKLIDAFYECHYWSCTRLPIDVLMAHCMDQKDVSQRTEQLKLSTIDSRARALSVRCQKIDEEE